MVILSMGEDPKLAEVHRNATDSKSHQVIVHGDTMNNRKLIPALSAAKAKMMERENKFFQRSRKPEYSLTT